MHVQIVGLNDFTVAISIDCDIFCIYFRTDTTVIGCSGFHGDCLTLTKIIDARLKVRSIWWCFAEQIYPFNLFSLIWKFYTFSLLCTTFLFVFLFVFRCTSTQITRTWQVEPLLPCCQQFFMGGDFSLIMCTISLAVWMSRVSAVSISFYVWSVL